MKPAMATTSTSLGQQKLDDPGRVGGTVEAGIEAITGDEAPVEPGRGGHVEGAAGPVDHDEPDRQRGSDDRFQDRAVAGRQHGQAARHS